MDWGLDSCIKYFQLSSEIFPVSNGLPSSGSPFYQQPPNVRTEKKLTKILNQTDPTAQIRQSFSKNAAP